MRLSSLLAFRRHYARALDHRGLAIDVPAMTDVDDGNDELLILNVADDAIVADTITPEIAEFEALQGMAASVRVVITRNSICKKGHDARCVALA